MVGKFTLSYVYSHTWHLPVTSNPVGESFTDITNPGQPQYAHVVRSITLFVSMSLLYPARLKPGLNLT